MRLSATGIYYVIVKKDKFKDVMDIKKETELSFFVLKKMLELFDIEFMNVSYTENGKPYFKDSDIHFNYSHSKNYIAVAISTTSLGVDIEERIVTDSVSDLYLGSARGRDKLKNWVLKESYVKLEGSGLKIFRDVDVNKITSNYKLIDGGDYMCSIMYNGSKRRFVNLQKYI